MQLPAPVHTTRAWQFCAALMVAQLCAASEWPSSDLLQQIPDGVWILNSACHFEQNYPFVINQRPVVSAERPVARSPIASDTSEHVPFEISLRKCGTSFTLQEERVVPPGESDTRHIVFYRETNFLVQGMPDTVRTPQPPDTRECPPFTLIVDRKRGKLTRCSVDDPYTSRMFRHKFFPMTRVLWLAEDKDVMITNNAFIHCPESFGRYCLWTYVCE